MSPVIGALNRRDLVVVPILAYHSVATNPTSSFRRYTVTPGQLAEHLTAIQDAGWHFITASTAAALLGGVRPCQGLQNVALTVDDGFADFTGNAVQVLAEHLAPTTLFVPTAFPGKTAKWLSRADRRPLLDWNELRDLAATGVEIGSHGHTHTPLDTACDEVVRHEALISRMILEDKLGVPVSSFAYPYGYHTRAVRRAVAQAGYQQAFAVTGSRASSWDDRFALPRIEVTNTQDPVTLLARLNASYLRASRHWAVGKQRAWCLARRVLPLGPSATAALPKGEATRIAERCQVQERGGEIDDPGGNG